MATKPSYFPVWASEDTTLPSTSNTNKVQPTTTLQTIGWDKGQIPTAEEWNWQFNNIYQWTEYFDDLSSTYLPKTGTVINLTGDATGTVSSTSSTLSIPVTVTDNSHNHISANITDATSDATANMIVLRDANAGANFAALTGTNVTATGTLAVTGISTFTNSMRASQYIDVGYQNTTAGNRQITFYSAGTTTGTATLSVSGTTISTSIATLTAGTINLTGNAYTSGYHYVGNSLRASAYLDLGYQNTTAGSRSVTFYSAGGSTPVETAQISVTGSTLATSVMAITAQEIEAVGNFTANALSTHVGNASFEGELNSSGTNTFTGTTNFTQAITLQSSSVAQNGYTYLPNGVIMQWGLATIPITSASQASVAVTFPLAFPNACFSITSNTTAQTWSASDGYMATLACVGATKTGFTLWGDSDNSLNATVAQPCYWTAIGH